MKQVPKLSKPSQLCNRKMRKKKLLHFRSGKIKPSTRRRALLTPLPMLRPKQGTRGTPTKATPDQETTPTGTGNTASTANYRITHRMNVSKGFKRRNRAEIGKAEPIGQECT